MQQSKQEPEKETEATYSLLYLTSAYNRGEITLEEWLALSKEWAERIIQQQSKPETT